MGKQKRGVLMSVESVAAAKLVHQIFDLQRAVRCVATANLRGQDTGVALQGVLRFVGDNLQYVPMLNDLATLPQRMLVI